MLDEQTASQPTERNSHTESAASSRASDAPVSDSMAARLARQRQQRSMMRTAAMDDAVEAAAQLAACTVQEAPSGGSRLYEALVEPINTGALSLPCVVLGLLRGQDLCAAELVCKLWRDILVADDAAWLASCEATFGSERWWSWRRPLLSRLLAEPATAVAPDGFDRWPVVRERSWREAWLRLRRSSRLTFHEADSVMDLCRTAVPSRGGLQGASALDDALIVPPGWEVPIVTMLCDLHTLNQTLPAGKPAYAALKEKMGTLRILDYGHPRRRRGQAPVSYWTPAEHLAIKSILGEACDACDATCSSCGGIGIGACGHDDIQVRCLACGYDAELANQRGTSREMLPFFND